MIDWSSPWLGVLGFAALVGTGWKWAFHPDRVIGNSKTLFADSKTIRWVGYFMFALASAVLFLSRYDLISE